MTTVPTTLKAALAANPVEGRRVLDSFEPFVLAHIADAEIIDAYRAVRRHEPRGEATLRRIARDGALLRQVHACEALWLVRLFAVTEIENARPGSKARAAKETTM